MYGGAVDECGNVFGCFLDRGGLVDNRFLKIPRLGLEQTTTGVGMCFVITQFDRAIEVRDRLVCLTQRSPRRGTQCVEAALFWVSLDQVSVNLA